ncbi:hypothetical protein [Pseudooceanicola sp. MF1-13]|uniref:hypothetical protein n=1 Tax=Pseudooceanicola sp. MF1-13 TaxID=3379095 RepID=UPI003892A1DB
MLLAADTFAGDYEAAFLANPHAISGMSMDFDDLFIEIFNTLDLIEATPATLGSLDIDLPALLDREDGGIAHQTVELDELMQIAEKIAEDGDFDLVGPSSIDIAANDWHDFYQGDGEISHSDAIRNAFGSQLIDQAGDFFAGISFDSFVNYINGLSSVAIDMPDDNLVGTPTTSYLLDVNATGVTTQDDGFGNIVLSFGLELEVERTDTFSLDFGRNADLLSLIYGADESGDAGMPDISVTSGMSFSADATFFVSISFDDGGTPGDTSDDETTITYNNGALGLTGVDARFGAEADVTGLAFDAQLGFLEIDVEGDFGMEAFASYSNAGFLSLFSLSGLSLNDADIDVAGSLSASFTASAALGGSGELSTLATEFAGRSFEIDVTVADIFASGALFGSEDGSVDPRTAPKVTLGGTDFDAWFEPFTNLNADELLTYIAQFRSFLLQFQNAPDLFGFDIPFIDDVSLLGQASLPDDAPADALPYDLLDWASPVQALIDGLYTEGTGNAASALLPEFDSLQSLVETAFNTPLVGLSFNDDLGVLEFNLEFGNSTQLLDQDLDFNFNFGPLENFDFDGDIDINGALTLSFLMGIDLGGATEVSIASSEVGLGLISLHDGSGSRVNLNFSNPARFKLQVNGLPAFDVSVPAEGGGYASLDALATALQTAITDAINTTFDPGERPTIVVDNIDGDRISIRAPGNTFLKIVEIDDTDPNDFSALGFNNGQTANVSPLPDNGVLSGTAEFDLVLDGTTYTVSLATDSGNGDIDDLLADLEAAIAAAEDSGNVAIGAGRVDVRAPLTGDGAFKLVLLDDSVTSMELSGANAVAVTELGLRNTDLSSRVQLIGDREISFSGIAVDGLPADGILANDLEIDVTLTIEGVETTYDVIVPASATYGMIEGQADERDNESPSDLLADIRDALQAVEVSDGVTLGEYFELDNDDEQLIVRSFFENVDAISISDNLGILGNIEGVLTTGLASSGQFEVSGVDRTDLVFLLEVTQTDGTLLSHEINISDAGNGSIADIIADMNADIAGSAIDGFVAAGTVGSRLTFAAISSDVASIRISQLDDNGADNEERILGLENGASAVAPPVSGAFAADITITAAIDAVASGFGEVDLGFLGISAGVSGTANADVSGTLRGGAVLGQDNAIGFQTLFDAASGKLYDGTNTDAVDAGLTWMEFLGLTSAPDANLSGGLGAAVSGDVELTFSGVNVSGSGGVLDDIAAYIGAIANATEREFTLSVDDIVAFDPSDIILPGLGSLDENLAAFFAFDFGDVQNAFQQAGDFLEGVMDLEFLGTALPFVGLDLSEALGFVSGIEGVIDSVLEFEVDTVQDLTDAVYAALEAVGVDPGSISDLIEFQVNSPGALVFNLGFDRDFGGTLPINFSLADLIGDAFELPGIDRIADLSGAANLAANFGADVNLAFGVDITNPLNALFIDTANTGISITGEAEASEVSFIGALGPLAALIDGGSLRLGGDSITNEIFSLDMAALGVPNNRLDLLEVLDPDSANNFASVFDDIFNTADVLDIDFNFDAVLPVFVQFGGASTFIGNLSFDAIVDSFEDLDFFIDPGDFDFGTLEEVFTNLQLPDFDLLGTLFGDDFLDNLGLLDTIQLFVEGLDLVFGSLGDLFTGELLGLDGIGDIPLVGDAFEDAGQFFDDIRNNLIAPISDLIDQSPEILAGVFEDILAILNDTLSQFTDEAFGLALRFVNDAGDTLADLIQTATSSFDINEVGGTFTDLLDLIQQAHGFEVVFNFGDTYEVDLPDVSFGLPGLGLEIEDNVTLGFMWDIFFTIGLNLDEGLYVGLADGDEAEIELKAALNLPDETTISLGFLSAKLDNERNGTVQDGNATGESIEIDWETLENNDLFGYFAFDIIADGGTLGIADIPTASFDVGYGVGVDINFDARLGVGGFIPDGAASNFPSIIADLGLQVGFGNWIGMTDPGLPGLPEVTFNDVGLDVGEFLTNTLQPVVSFVNTYIEPILPLINLLTDPIPVISDLNGEVSLLDIAAQFGVVDQGLVDAIELIVGILNDLAALDVDEGALVIWLVGGHSVFGIDSFSLGGESEGVGDERVDLTNPASLTSFTDPTQAFSSIIGAIPGLDVFDGLLTEGSLQSGLNTLSGGTSGGTGLLNSNSSTSGGAGLVFPFLEDPTQILGLLFGRDATLIGLDLPPLVFGFEYSQFFSIWGPIGVTLGGAFSATFDFDVAFDTYGIRKFAESDFKNFGAVFDGFYFLDDSFENPGVDSPEITLYGEITAALALNIGVAEAGVGGGLFGTFTVDWNDPNGDLKVRFSEIADNIAANDGNILCIFDYRVFLEAKLFVYVEALFGLFEKRWYFGPELPLIDEDIICRPDPILASGEGDILRLNMGDYAYERKYEGEPSVTLNDVDEIFFVYQSGNEVLVDAIIDGQHVGQQSYGNSSQYSLVLGRAGLESDAIFMDGTTYADYVGGTGPSQGAVMIAGDLKGDVGNDTLVGGAMSDTILGDEGDDLLVGGAAPDVLIAGTGNDRAKGDGGNDTILGEDGNDTLLGGAGADLIDGDVGNDVIGGGDDDDVVWAREGNDIIAGGGGNDTLSGSLGDDMIWGDLDLVLNADCFLETDGDSLPLLQAPVGTDGNDVIGGGADNDWISGDGGNDFVWGDSDIREGANRSVVTAGASNTYVDLETGQTVVDLDAGDGLTQKSIVAPGRGGADVISGGAGDDTLLGEDGNDVLRGDQFDDLNVMTDRFVAGQTTDRAGRALSGSGNDVMIGEKGADVIFGNGGDDWGFGGSGTDFLLGNDGHDSLRGSAGRDVLFGDNGEIIVFENGDTNRVFDEGVASSYMATTFDAYQLSTIDPTIGGADDLIGGIDDDVIFGGTNDVATDGEDTIDGQGGRDLIFGDHGQADFTYDSDIGISLMTYAFTTDTGNGDGDIIFGGLGEDTVFGGTGSDQISGDAEGADDPQSPDVLLGDFGQMERLLSLRLKKGFLSEISTDLNDVRIVNLGATVLATEYGDDTITGGGAADIMFGGLGMDTLDGGLSEVNATSVNEEITQRDIIVGDDGYLTYVAEGADTLFWGDSDLVGDDQHLTIDLDSGPLELTLDLVETLTNVAAGDADLISGGAHADIILAGGGADVVYGDADIAGNNASTDDDGIDVVIGDQGFVALTEALIRAVASNATSNVQGGGDTVRGNAGNDVIIGGVSNGGTDSLTGGLDDDMILGDEGVVLFTFDDGINVRDRIYTTQFALGGADIIEGNQGSDIGIGGTGADSIFGDNQDADVLPGSDLLIGDQGEIEYFNVSGTDTSEIDYVRSTDTADADGGADTIEGGDGGDIIIGGVLSDHLYGEADNSLHMGGTGSFGDVILGDEGEVRYREEEARYGLTNDSSTIDEIRTTQFGLGAGDFIFGNKGDDTAMGGTAADEIYGDNLDGELIAGAGDDLLIGDQGEVLNRTFNLPTLSVAVLDQIRSTDLSDADGGADTIEGNDGSDVIIGGVLGDLLHGEADAPALVGLGGTFDDIILGDEGEVTYDTTNPFDRERETIATNLTNPGSGFAELGASDLIFGNQGNDVALGGTAGDQIYGDIYYAGNALAMNNTWAGGNDDILLGDYGLITYNDHDTFGGVEDTSTSYVDTIQTTDPSLGGSDTVAGDDADDIVIGGAFGDNLYGEQSAALLWLTAGRSGNDILMGDNAEINYALDSIESGASGASVQLDIDLSTRDRIITTDQNDGGNDTMFGNGGDDALMGGTFADLMWGDSGDGGLLGGGASESDPDGADLMLGDHGVLYDDVARAAAAGTSVTWNDFVLSQFITAADGGEGDMMFGNGADDVMMGQQGDDVMFGGTGNDDMIGGHNVEDGIDEQDGDLTGDDYDLLADGLAGMTPLDMDNTNDVMDGGTGADVMAGDNAAIVRQIENTSPRMQLVGPGGAMYSISTYDVDGYAAETISIDEAITANIAGVDQNNPDHVANGFIAGRDVTILDHDIDIQNGAAGAPGDAHAFGNDIMAGAAGDDEMWGQLGDDIMQGDGAIELVVAPLDQAGNFDPTQGADPSFFIPSDLDDEGGDTSEPYDYVALNVDEVTAYGLNFRVAESTDDGDDYMEGGAGNDRMYGNLGSDDMIGGSSSLFGLATDGLMTGPDELRPDGADLMYGAAGVAERLARGATDDHDHGFDSDTMLGDNGNIYRIIAADLSYESFDYDDSTTDLIIPRAVTLLDYGYDANFDASAEFMSRFTMVSSLDTTGYGAGDLMYGEAGDDFMHGQTGDDVMFGNAGDDALHGERGNDILYGGTGQDGILGDDGLLRKARIPLEANGNGEELMVETLWGINHTLQVNEEISTPGNLQRSIINIEGALYVEADLLAFRTGTDAGDQQFNDIIFGGWQSDWIHGGEGDDAVSGAEALPFYYSAAGSDFTTINTLLASMQNGSSLFDAENPAQPLPFWSAFALYNPGEILRHEGKMTGDDVHQNFGNFEAEFAAYDSYNPRDRVFVDTETGLSVPIEVLIAAYNFDPETGVLPDGVIEFILNFETEGEGQTEADIAAGDSQYLGFPVDGVTLWNDGDDRIFGDLGNDWIVGGTGRDNMYGGRGNDLLNMDDEHNTNGMLNDDPDAYQAYGDIAYGGAGRDVLILNTGADRSIDWVGEFNSYIVPFSPFGAFHISRSLQPQLAEYLLDLSEADGADRTGPDLGLYLEHKSEDVKTYDPDADRNLEPFGELGMVRQQDFDWGDQTGAPADPQAGNIQGKREIMRRALFSDEPLQGGGGGNGGNGGGNGNAQGFAATAGTWQVQSGSFDADPVILGEEAVSLFHLGEQQPEYMELLATVNMEKDKQGWGSNGFVIFDYQDENTFKFAGVDAATDKIQIGERTIDGWNVLTQSNMQMRDGTNYNLTVALNGTLATIYVNGQNATSHNFGDPLNDGYIGLATNGARASFDNWQVQKLPPVITFENTYGFDADMGDLSAQSGLWSVSGGRLDAAVSDGFALAATPIDVALYSMVEVESVFETDDTAGVVFDYYSDTNFKFAALDSALGQVVIGHVTDRGVNIDVSADVDLSGSGDHTLVVRMLGSGVSVSLDGTSVVGHAYGAILNDGGVGVMALDGAASFETVTVRGDDPAYGGEPEAEALVADSISEGIAAQDALDAEQLAEMAAVALQMWADELGVAVEDLGISVEDFVIADFDGATLAQEDNGTIYVDADAAGHGWFIDETPGDDVEFEDGTGPDGIDLLSALIHEIGHALGEDHTGAADGTVMDPTLSEGERLSFTTADAGFADETGEDVAIETDGDIDWVADPEPTNGKSGKKGNRPDYLYELDNLDGVTTDPYDYAAE